MTDILKMYDFNTVNDIDSETLDYLRFVSPEPVEDLNIQEINNFLNTLEKFFIELDGESLDDG